MKWYRIRHTIGLYTKGSGQARANYIKKHNIFYHMGDKCMVMFRKIPLYPKLISIGNNVWIASDVLLVTHDVIHRMLNNVIEEKEFKENIGVIDIKDNVFIGSSSTILPNVTIGPNTVVAAGSLVNKSICGGVYAGVPARYICSLEEFIEKRRNMQDMMIEKNKGHLTEATVEAFWKQHVEMEEKHREQ